VEDFKVRMTLVNPKVYNGDMTIPYDEVAVGEIIRIQFGSLEGQWRQPNLTECKVIKKTKTKMILELSNKNYMWAVSPTSQCWTKYNPVLKIRVHRPHLQCTDILGRVALNKEAETKIKNNLRTVIESERKIAKLAGKYNISGSKVQKMKEDVEVETFVKTL
jgi:hypothetical protein